MTVQAHIEPRRKMSIDTFFEQTERLAEKYELVEGEPFLLPWVKLNHNRVVMNLTRIFLGHLDPGTDELANGDFALQVGESSIRYADLMVLPAGKPGNVRVVSDAKLLVEVLSDSTMHTDFGEKLREYQALDSLHTYLIFAQTPAIAWKWSRDAKGMWLPEPATINDLSGVVTLEAFGFDIPLSEVYRNVV